MKKNILTLLSFLLIGSTFTSCLKDDSLVLNPAKTNNVIEFANPGQISSVGTVYPLYVLAYDYNATKTTATVPVTISYSGPEAVAPQDITVKVAIGTDAEVQAYNDEGNQDDELFFMPAANYTNDALTAVIKKGTSKAVINFTFDFTKFDLNKALTLPLTITEASSGVISGNFKTVLLNIGPKNIFDGLFTFNTTATTSLQANKNDKNVPLVTSGVSTVKTNLLNTYSNIIVYNIDPTTFKATVVSVTPSIGTPITDPVSNWDPAKKILYVKWAAGTRRFEETYTYTGSR